MKHKKTIKKASVIILLAISLVFVLPFSAFCAEATDISEDTRQEHSVAPNEPLENTDTENPYSVIFNTFLENSPQILSALAFIGSIIIMLCYKKGLIPLIKEALSALSSGVKSIGEKTENIGSDSKRISNEK